MQTGIETSKGSAATPDLSERPNIFAFNDYRRFLSLWLAFKRKTNPHYSTTLFAKRAGIGSHTLLGMVIRGDRNLSQHTMRAFSKGLGLEGREAIYFEKLVSFNQSKKSEDKAYYFEQLTSMSQKSGSSVLTDLKDHAQYFNSWYVMAVRQLVPLEDFKPDADWISDKLKNKITRKQAQDAWDLLLKIGIVEWDADNSRYFLPEPKIDIDPGQIDFAIRQFHKDFLERAKDAIDGEAFDERELSSLVLSVAQEDIERLKERVREFRKSLNREFPVSREAVTEAVAINMQLLVLTQKNKKS